MINICKFERFCVTFYPGGFWEGLIFCITNAILISPVEDRLIYITIFEKSIVFSPSFSVIAPCHSDMIQDSLLMDYLHRPSSAYACFLWNKLLYPPPAGALKGYGAIPESLYRSPFKVACFILSRFKLLPSPKPTFTFIVWAPLGLLRIHCMQ